MNPYDDVLAMDERVFRLWSERSKNAPFGPDPEAAARLIPGRKSSGSVAVIPLSGFLTPKPTLFSALFGGTSVQEFARETVAALRDSSIGAVVMLVDSPGGVVSGMTEAAATIREARGGKPLVAVADSLMASAAYWIASQADEIVASPSGMVGSIGVFATHVNEAKALEQAGLEVTFVSSAPKKMEGNSAEPLSDGARSTLQSRVDYFGRMFEADVAAGRKVSPNKVASDFGQGALMTADAALSAGLVDRVATTGQVLDRLVAGYKRVGRAYDETELAALARLGGVTLDT